MMNLKKEFEIKIKDFQPLKGKKLCVALSGGADSVCLLNLLNSIAENSGFLLSAAHINHCLRGEESNRDMEFCKDLCNQLNVPLNVFEIDVSALTKKGESIEEAARRLRYNALYSVDCDYIVTAHHGNDNIETFIINLLRGTGLKGLCGIPEKRDKILRPLLGFSQKDILNYCNENNLSFVTDSTNNSDDYTRNLLRHKVIPILEEINPSFNVVFCRNLEHLKRDEDFLSHIAVSRFSACLEQNKLNCEILSQEHDAIIFRVVKMYCEDIFGVSVDTAHINEFVKIIKAGKGRYQLSKEYTAVVLKGSFYLQKCQKTEFSVEIQRISDDDIISYIKINNLLLKNAIDYDKIFGELGFRTRKAGDKLKLSENGVSKSLRRWQQEKGIPIDLRDVSPVAFDDSGALWCYEIGADCRVSVDSATKNAIIFNVYEK